MAYPTDLDNFTEITCATTTDPKDVVNDIHDVIEAIEAKLGVDDSAVVTSIDYLLKDPASENPGHTHTLAEGATDVTASATELNQLDGKTLSGLDTEIITGTNGTSGNLAQWNGDGDLVDASLVSSDITSLLTGWVPYTAVVPTRTTDADPNYVITFAGVDLTSRISVGMRVSWIQNSTRRYGIVQAIAFSTNTTLTLYGGTDYNVENTGTHVISGFQYSFHKAPYGFPMDPDKWSLTSNLVTTNEQQSTPSNNTWYNTGAVTVANPIGKWWMASNAVARVSTTGSLEDMQIFTTVSTANNTESSTVYTSYNRVEGEHTPGGRLGATVTGAKSQQLITSTSAGNLYLNIKCISSSIETLQLRGDVGTAFIKLVNAYL